MTLNVTNWNAEPPHAIASLGECMIEVTTGDDGRLQQHYGGDTLNTAVYLARLLPRPITTVDYVTVLGDDPFSRAMLDEWSREGLGIGLVRVLKGRLPGLYWIVTNEQGERSFYYWRREAPARSLVSGQNKQNLTERLAAYQLVYLSGITLAILSNRDRARLLHVLEEIRSRGVRIVFDTNFRLNLWRTVKQAREWIDAVSNLVDVAVVSFDDQRAMFTDAAPVETCSRLASHGIGEIVVKNGAGPCTISADGHTASVATSSLIEVADTTAAGDSFNAAYIAARLSGVGVEEAARAGHNLAQKVIGYHGAILPAQETPNLVALMAADESARR